VFLAAIAVPFATSIVNANGIVYFAGVDPISGNELHRINASGFAELVENSSPGGGIFAGSQSSNPGQLINVNGTLYFDASDGINGRELWRIGLDGLAEMVEDDSELHRKNLVKVLDTLEEKDLQLIEMRFFEQRPFKEIADVLGMTESNAKVKTYRILERLKTKLTKLSDLS